MTRFRRFSRRRQLRALAVALLDRVEWGPPIVCGYPLPAQQDGICAGCGSAIDRGQRIVPALYGPPGLQSSTFVHETCPDLWQVLDETVERYDDKIITKINLAGRGRAAGCGHDVEGQPVYLVRRPVSMRHANHSGWHCEACVTPQTKEEP